MEKLYVKNMVCNRCVMVVENLLRAIGAEVAHITLGEVVLTSALSDQQRKQLIIDLETMGFELLDDRRSRLIEHLKSSIRELVHRKENRLKVNLSSYLSEQLGLDYTYLTTLFSESEGTTLEKYYIAQKIERVKELLLYDDLSLSEIAYRMNYSSVAHLSSQFKKVTGFTPSYYKQMRDKRRKPLDKV